MPSIKEKLEKIKGIGDWVFKNNAVFNALLIILVALGAFGLGRLSKIDENKTSFSFTDANVASMVQAASDDTTLPEGDLNASIPIGGLYVASKNSDKYHAPWCSGAQRIKIENQIWFNSKEEAESAGYTPASNCKGI